MATGLLYFLNCQLNTKQSTAALDCMKRIDSAWQSGKDQIYWRPRIVDPETIIETLQVYYFNEHDLGLHFDDTTNPRRIVIYIYNLSEPIPEQEEDLYQENLEAFKWYCEEVLSRTVRPLIKIKRPPKLKTMEDYLWLYLDYEVSQYLQTEYGYKIQRRPQVQLVLIKTEDSDEL